MTEFKPDVEAANKCSSQYSTSDDEFKRHVELHIEGQRVGFGSRQAEVDRQDAEILQLIKDKESWGNEFTAVIAMKNEVAKLNMALDRAEEALRYYADDESGTNDCEPALDALAEIKNIWGRG